MRRIRRVSACVAALLAIVVCAGWLMFQHIPAWYQPIVISAPGDLDRVRQDLSGTYDRLDTAILLATGPFEFRLREDQINAWLAARENIEPATKGWLPAMLSDPFIHVEHDGLRVAATIHREELKAVLSAHLSVQVAPDFLRLHISEVRAGRLPVPDEWLRGALSDMSQRLQSVEKSKPGRTANKTTSATWNKILTGIDLKNTVVSDYINRPFRIVGLRFEPPEIVATLEPMSR